MRKGDRCAGIVLLLLLSGCLGYRGYRKQLPPELAGLSVSIFENRTQYPGVEIDVTRRVKEEFRRRLGSAVASHGGEASKGPVLSGALVEYAPREAIAVERGGGVSERQVVVGASVRIATAEGKVLFETPRIAASATYRTASGGGEARARREAIEELARRVALAVLDRW